jgi:hypothetical protein
MRGRGCNVWFTLHAVKVAAAGEAPSRVIPDKASKRNFEGKLDIALEITCKKFRRPAQLRYETYGRNFALRLGSRVSKLRGRAKVRYATSRRNCDDCNLDHV